jgi:hypothetical protein
MEKYHVIQPDQAIKTSTSLETRLSLTRLGPDVSATIWAALVSFQNYHSIEWWLWSVSYSGTNHAASIFRDTGNTRRLLITTS